MKNNVKNLIEFIDHSPSCFHVIENARKQFLEHGFMELKEKEYWDLEEGKSYLLRQFFDDPGTSTTLSGHHMPSE